MDEAFVSTGFSNWKHALCKKGGLPKHDKRIRHKDAIICLNGYKHMQQSNSSVADMAGSTRAQQVAKNVHYIKSIAEVILGIWIQWNGKVERTGMVEWNGTVLR